MNNYCGFIEVWGNGRITRNGILNTTFQGLQYSIIHTKKVGLKTVAIFKIKLK